MLDTPTWRANPDWGARLGYAPDDLDAANRSAVALADESAPRARPTATPVVINGVHRAARRRLRAGELMSADEARALPRPADRDVRRQRRRHGHRHHDDLRRGGDRHRARRARRTRCPAVISFTVETDGRLPDGQLAARRDRRASTPRPTASVAYYMINCAHPTHFAGVLDDGRRLARAHRRPARQRVGQEPRRARRGRGARRGRPRRAGRRARRAARRAWAPWRCSAAAAAPTTAMSTRSPAPGVSFARMRSTVVAALAGVALAAGGFAAGRLSTDSGAGHDAGVREGHAAGLEEGRALQATGAAARAPARRSPPAMPPAPTTSSRASMAGGRCRSPTSSRWPAAAARSPIASTRAVWRGSGRSGDGRRTHGDGGEEVEQALRDAGVAGDLELGARGIEPEGLHPRALGTLDAGVRLGRAALLVDDVAVVDVQNVDAGPGPSAIRSSTVPRSPVGAARPGAQRRIAPTSIASPGRGGPQAQR